MKGASMYRKDLEKLDFASNSHKLMDIIDMLMCEVKDVNYDLFKHIKGEIYEMVYGKTISEDMASNWVNSMYPVGPYWTMEQTTSAMKSMGFSHNKVEFYVVANMMKNDYDDLIDDELALHLAHNWLDDKDAKEYKLYEYWKHIVKVK
jgi:hypothetical protein